MTFWYINVESAPVLVHDNLAGGTDDFHHGQAVPHQHWWTAGSRMVKIERLLL
jgi:hypothetical protein